MNGKTKEGTLSTVQPPSPQKKEKTNLLLEVNFSIGRLSYYPKSSLSLDVQVKLTYETVEIQRRQLQSTENLVKLHLYGAGGGHSNRR